MYLGSCSFLRRMSCFLAKNRMSDILEAICEWESERVVQCWIFSLASAQYNVKR